MERITFDVRVFGNIVEIIPKVPITDNSLYNIKLKNIKSLDGQYELENTTIEIYTAITPAYTTVDSVNSIIGDCEIEEKDILIKIREASRTADFIIKGINGPTYVNNTDIMIPKIKEQSPGYVPNLTPVPITKSADKVQETFYLKAGETEINLNKGFYMPGGDEMELFVDGLSQPQSAFLETTPKQVVLKQPIDEDVLVTLVYNDRGADNGGQVRYEVPFEVSEYTKYKAAKECLLKFYVGKAAIAGEKGTLGDISFEHQPKMPDIGMLIKELTAQIQFWQDAIRGYGIEGRARPKATLHGRNAIPLSSGAVHSISPINPGYSRGI